MKADFADLNIKDSHHFLTVAVLPRPIAWVSTVSADGIYNLAPFSFFTAASSKPAIIAFCVARKRDGTKKDTLVNIESTKAFVINVVSESLAKAMNMTATPYPPGVDEFKEARLTPVPADLVNVPMVAESPINIECRLNQILEFGEAPKKTSFIVGDALRVHIKDELWINNEVQTSQLRAIGRMGGDLYCRTTDIFEMKMPANLL